MWHELDYENSYLNSEIDDEAFEILALEALADEQIDPTESTVILGTHYALEKSDEESNVLILKGHAIIKSLDERHGDPSRFIVFDV